MKYFIPVLLFLMLASCGQQEGKIPRTKEDILPEDTLNFMRVTFNKQTGNCNEACCTILLEYPFFSGNISADSLNRRISTFFCTAMGQGSSTVIAEAWDKTSRTFREQVEKYPDQTVSWNYEGTGEIKYKDEKIISVVLSMYSFEGGAHPNTQVELFSYDMNDRRKLMLGDIFTDEKEITRIAEQQFRSDKNIPEEQSLADAGFDLETFYLTENFLLTDKEIIFYYNTYEIAPYVLGPTELVLSLKKISHLLKSEKTSL